MDIYAENILDHSRSPHGKKPIAKPTIEHEESNPACGDVLSIQLKIVEDPEHVERKDEKIIQIGWSGEGCAISQAGMSLLFEKLKGMNLSEIEALNAQTMHDLLGVPIGPRRIKCALLALHVLKNAVHKLKEEEAQSWNKTIEEKGI
jgi:nitrogen fixation protein NifU and related proteins